MDIRRFREQTKNQVKGNGILYLIFVASLCLLSVGLGIYLLVPITFTWKHLLFILGSIVFSNFVEYFLHRFPMHNLTFLKGIYRMHTGVHHRFFTSELMHIESKEDIFHVSTSIKVICLFVCSIILPISFLIGLLSSSFGILFFITAMSYYLVYELTHLYCHLPPDRWWGNIPYFRSCRRRHRRHHNSKIMRTKDFNVSFPLMDILFRTRSQ